MAGVEHSDDEVAHIVDEFVSARRAGRALADYPGRVPATLASAYRCQMLATQRWHDRIGGWKVARIPPHARDQYSEERLIGPAFAANIHVAEGTRPVRCGVFEGGFAAVEAELVIRVGRSPARRDRKWDSDAVKELVGSLHIGAEIASSPFALLNQFGPGAVISDFGNNWGIVVGPAIKNWQLLEQITAQTFIDGEQVGQGVVSIRDGALGALAFVLNHCEQRGAVLKEGDLISTGMITGVHDVRPGQGSRLVFESFGEVYCQIEKQTAVA